MSNTDPEAADRVTVYFDGSCPLCSAEIGYYKKRDVGGGLDLVDVSDPNFAGDADLTRADAMARFHVRLANGEVRSGARAFVEVWRKTPGWRWLSHLARVPGVVLIMEGAYRLFLRARALMVRGFVRVRRGSCV